MNNIQHLMLAAGASKRMGKPKQLLQWGKETLIEHQIHVLLEANNKISVVLGAYSDKISEIINKLPIDIYTNQLSEELKDKLWRYLEFFIHWYLEYTTPNK